jgi:hypothetical protein
VEEHSNTKFARALKLVAKYIIILIHVECRYQKGSNMNPPTDHIIEEAMHLSLDELKAVSERILEEIEEREWDRILATPESIAYHERMRAEIEEDKAAGHLIEYIPGKSLEELFQD